MSYQIIGKLTCVTRPLDVPCPVQTREEEAEAPAEDLAPQETEMEVAVTQAAEEPEGTEAAVEPAEAEAAQDVLQKDPVTEDVSGGEVPEEAAEMEVLAAEEAAEAPAEDAEPIAETEVLLPDHPPFTELLSRTSGTNVSVFSRTLLLSLWKSHW